MNRRRFLVEAGHALLAASSTRVAAALGNTGEATRHMNESTDRDGTATLFVCGDVMTGRGIDQILARPGEPAIHESYAKSALDYVRLAEEVNGPLARPVSDDYIWGSALEDLAQAAPDVRIINLETSVTTSDDHWPDKSIHYRMHPANIACLESARIDCCVLANNHVLDWGHAGLDETLVTLESAGLRTAGAGRNQAEAQRPAIVELPRGGRVLVFAFGALSSGIPPAWAATAGRGGVNLLDDLGPRTLQRIAGHIERQRREGDLVVASIHWGGNWGYEVPAKHRNFAQGLIDAGVDVVHGHSSHHPLAIEVYRERPVLYGCGDLLNDYEGIPGFESFRGDLSLLYFIRLETGSGRLLGLEMAPQQIRRFRLNRAIAADAEWLCDVLDREGRPFGSRVELGAAGNLHLRWG